MKSVRLALLPLALCIGTPALASDDSQFWGNTTATVKLSDKLRFSEDVTVRFGDKANGLYEIEMNSLLGYRVGKGVTVWAGYTHDPNYTAGHFKVMEHRAREQVTVDRLAAIGGGQLSGRLRTEQRWRDGFNGTGWRVRPFVKYSLPLQRGKRTALVLSAEFFFNLNRTAFQRTEGLDRTRTFIGLSTPIAKNITAEAGYLNQHIFVPHAADHDDHVASIALSFSL